ncbi:conserved hypothetical protein [Rhodospirillaceae bacterium LM-1]|nr:conserved hypothetical protein [Rhodospirillaceae bacterium LM-1]
MTEFGTKHWPLEIRLKRAEKSLEVTFEDGLHFAFPAEFLRVNSPSAEVQGHSPAERKLVSGRKHVGILEVKPVGNYAVKLVFDDLHDSGLYSWDLLYDYGMRQGDMWQAYEAELASAGLSREPERRD